MNSLDEVITLTEAAQLCCLSYRMLVRRAKAGKFEARKSGGVWLTTRAVVAGLGRVRKPKKRIDTD
jgi:hypothetical protein